MSIRTIKISCILVLSGIAACAQSDNAFVRGLQNATELAQRQLVIEQQKVELERQKEALRRERIAAPPQITAPDVAPANSLTAAEYILRVEARESARKLRTYQLEAVAFAARRLRAATEAASADPKTIASIGEAWAALESALADLDIAEAKIAAGN